jgi:hypothetical protein
MNAPEVLTTLHDAETDVTWHIFAYRELTEAEAVQAVQFFLQGTSRRKWPKSGSTETIQTVIGCAPGL